MRRDLTSPDPLNHHTPEALFAGLSNVGVLRSELRRLFSWLKKKGSPLVITGERGEGTLTRHGLEEYISDCVILLDGRVQNANITRRLRGLKYHGSTDGTSEYPLLIEEHGISVLPVTSLELKHSAPEINFPSEHLVQFRRPGRNSLPRGSVIMTGVADTGKTSMAAHFVNAACSRGEKAMLFSFKESSAQIIRNMNSSGIDLKR